MWTTRTATGTLVTDRKRDDGRASDRLVNVLPSQARANLMRLTAPIVGMLLIALTAAPAGAHGSWTHCGYNDVEVMTPTAWYYLVSDGTSGPWIWQEANGIQEVQIEDDNCHESSDAGVLPDILIF